MRHLHTGRVRPSVSAGLAFCGAGFNTRKEDLSLSTEAIKAKAEQVETVKEKIGKAKSVVLVDYRGLTVAEDTVMRAELRKANVEYAVIKNRIMLRAFAAAGYSDFDSVFEGPTAVAISYDDAVAGAKIISDTAKKTKKLAFKGGVVEGKAMDAQGIQMLSTIPSKNVLIAQMLGLLTSPMRSLAVAVSEIAKKNA